MNTHYALVVFSGDYDNDHPDPDLRGRAPDADLIAAGPEQFCWEAAARWTTKRPLQRGQHVEIVARTMNAAEPPPL
jgi:hypothetical protein